MQDTTESDSQKIAIVGMACRFPETNTLNEYWQNLLEGKVCTNKRRTWGDGYTATGGFLDDISLFDNEFFNISPHEARCMDPQLRLLLQSSWHAIEVSGASINELKLLNTGVFTTSLPGDYKKLIKLEDNKEAHSHSFIGNAPSAMSGRLSYYYDFHGPSINIDTACSSGLTALNIARLSIQSGDCDAALVGAATVFSTSELHQLAASTNMLSTSHRCKAFDDQADGFVPSEGVATLLVMTVKNATHLKLPIYAIIDELRLNHDGLSNGLMAPNPKAQEALLNKTHAKSRAQIKNLAMIETHGTGTKLGDPIELKGLEIIGKQLEGETCYLGASKTVIGHTLVCSGLASIIKVILSYQHHTIPPNTLFKHANTLGEIRPFTINKTPLPWPNDKHYAAISAFGFTGSNAHLILKLMKISDADSTRNGSNLFPPTHVFKKIRHWISDEATPQPKAVSLNNSMAWIKSTLSNLLGYDEDNIDESKNLLTLGIDSLTAIEFINALNKQGIKTSLDAIWKAPSLRAFTDTLNSTEETIPPRLSKHTTLQALSLKKSIYNESSTSWLVSTNAGRPLMLLPPLNTNYLAWLRQIPVLHSEGFQLHIPCYPGRNTQDNNTVTPISLDAIATDIIRYVDQLQIQPEFVGWSLGGILSLLVAIKAPSLANTLTLISTAAQFDDELFGNTIEMQAELTKQQDLFSIVYDSTRHVNEIISANTNMATLNEYYQSLIQLDISSESIKAISSPIHLIYGNNDPVISEHQIQYITNHTSASTTCYTNGGHFIPMTLSHQFNRDLLAFISPDQRL